MEEERRQNPRVRVNWPVTIETEEGTIERATYNISPDGAFIRGLSPLELHEVVDMTFSGHDHPITVKARVVWSSSQIPPDEDMPRGVGVEFINISDEHRTRDLGDVQNKLSRKVLAKSDVGEKL